MSKAKLIVSESRPVKELNLESEDHPSNSMKRDNFLLSLGLINKELLASGKIKLVNLRSVRKCKRKIINYFMKSPPYKDTRPKRNVPLRRKAAAFNPKSKEKVDRDDSVVRLQVGKNKYVIRQYVNRTELVKPEFRSPYFSYYHPQRK